ncbi:NADH-quinone oxidoreductase subunit M [Candidatus Bathyarchaeota archaeon]|nr:NADH-quinone oxidoreductase subunit M [Candidatus Bathyarchaeota archaeon]
MSQLYPLTQILIIPLAATPVVYLYARKMGRSAGYVAAIPLAYTLLLLLTLLPEAAKGVKHLESYTWAPSIGLTFGLLADGLSIWMMITINLLALLMSIYSVRYIDHRVKELFGGESPSTAYASYYALYLLYEVGMMGTVMSTNLIQFYLFYELMLVPSWLLINNYGYGDRERVGLLYFLWTHVGAVILLVGILSTYWITGSFEFSALSLIAAKPQAPFIVAAFLIGFLTKMAVFGLHLWLPDTYTQAPTSITALLSPAMSGIAPYAIVRFIVVPMYPVYQRFQPILVAWALITLIYGGLMSLAQDDVKRYLAYSSMSQMGYILLGVASMSTLGTSGAIFHYVSHGFGKCILFAVAGALLYRIGTLSISRMGGLADRMPVTATLTLLGIFTIAGVPPTSGFMSKWMIFAGVFDGPLSTSLMGISAATVILLMTVITIAYGLWIVKRIFFGPLAEGLEMVEDPPASMEAPLIILAVIAILVGLYPRIVSDCLFSALSALHV